jgi:hypothetical protein
MRAIILLGAGFAICVAVFMLAGQHQVTGSPASAVRESDGIGVFTRPNQPHRTPAESGIYLPAPPRGQPIAEVQAALRSRAEQGDAAAASTLARDLRLCWWMREQANIQKPDYRDPNEPRALSEDEQRWIDGWEQAQDFIERNAGYCKGIQANEIDKLMVSALLTAAKLGDEEAAACFVADGIYYARTTVDGQSWPAERDDAELAALYNAEALGVAEAGLKKGDWRMVAMLASAYARGDSANPFGYKLAAPNDEKRYLYGALSQLGVTNPDWLERIRAAPLDPAAFGLSEARARELRDEARQLFDEYFRDSGPYPEDFALCDM